MLSSQNPIFLLSKDKFLKRMNDDFFLHSLFKLQQPRVWQRTLAKAWDYCWEVHPWLFQLHFPSRFFFIPILFDCSAVFVLSAVCFICRSSPSLAISPPPFVFSHSLLQAHSSYAYFLQDLSIVLLCSFP